MFYTKKNTTKKRLEKIFQDVKRCLSLGSDVMENLTTFRAFLPFPNVLQLNIFAFFKKISKQVFGFLCGIRLNGKLAGWTGGLPS